MYLYTRIYQYYLQLVLGTRRKINKTQLAALPRHLPLINSTQTNMAASAPKPSCILCSCWCSSQLWPKNPSVQIQRYPYTDSGPKFSQKPLFWHGFSRHSFLSTQRLSPADIFPGPQLMVKVNPNDNIAYRYVFYSLFSFSISSKETKTNRKNKRSTN